MARQAGTITIARHGQPAISRDVRLNAAEYEAFWARYEIGGLAEPQSAPEHLTGTAEKADVVFVSTRRRAVDSARILVGNREVFEDVRLIEAPLPPPPFPAWVRLSPKLWGFFARFWWWFFDHHAGEESRAQAEARADLAAGKLEVLAASGQHVVVLAHGFFNVLIGRALRKRGWRMTLREGYKYWSTRRFVRDPTL